MSSTFEGLDSQRLWSLWDMLEFKAKPLFKAYQTLAYLSTVIPEITKRGANGNEKIVKDHANKQIEHLKEFLGYCEIVSLPTTIALAERMIESLKDATATYTIYGDRLGELLSRFRDELSATNLYALPAETAKFYAKGEEVFGLKIILTFSDAQDDFEEAAKCVALWRGTAAVFHLMRVMEVAIRKLGEKLKFATKDDKDQFLPWGVMIKNMADRIKPLDGTPEHDTWSEVQSYLQTLKVVWRNPTMHPKKNYTPEQAHEVLVASRHFLKHLEPLVRPEHVK